MPQRSPPMNSETIVGSGASSEMEDVAGAMLLNRSFALHCLHGAGIGSLQDERN